MEKYYQIVKINWKYNLVWHVILVGLMCLTAPAIMSMENLNPSQVAQVVELYVSFFGIILLVPLFLPDQDRIIRDLLESKKEPMYKIQIFRLLQALCCLSVFVALFLLKLQYGDCSFSFEKYFFGAIASCLFLGGLGILVFGFLDNVAVAYMVPIFYYILCYGAGKKLGKFYLFSMLKGSWEEKKYLLMAGIAMIIIGIVSRNIKTKRC